MLGIMLTDLNAMYSYTSLNITANYIVGMTPAFASVALMTLFDRKYLSRSMKQNFMHASVFITFIASLMVLWSYTQYEVASDHWPPQFLSDLTSFQQMIVLRFVLFLIGAPTLAYVLSALGRSRSNPV
jgi:MFS family permease